MQPRSKQGPRFCFFCQRLAIKVRLQFIGHGRATFPTFCKFNKSYHCQSRATA